jgi:tetratricopeptide (TPR) repeat protein
MSLRTPLTLVAALLIVFSAAASARPTAENPLMGVLARAELTGVRSLVRAGRYKEARQILTPQLRAGADEIALVSLARRLEVVEGFYPELDAGLGRSERALHGAISDFLHGRDREALLRASYALSLPVAAADMDPFLTRLEEITGVKAERLDPDLRMDLHEKKLEETKVFFESGRFDEVIRLCDELLLLVPRYPTALSRRGSALYLQQNYSKARDAWRHALAVENRQDERAALIYMIRRVNRKLGG